MRLHVSVVIQEAQSFLKHHRHHTLWSKTETKTNVTQVSSTQSTFVLLGRIPLPIPS